MNVFWKKKSQEEIKSHVFKALKLNVNYSTNNALGIPASYLDTKVFTQNTPFIKSAPYLSTLTQNPNHIGCHTIGNSESYFKGTQGIEKELLEICSVDILKGELGQQDGYVASGGTEANIQAIWIYRNFYLKEFTSSIDEICIICSDDSHYSMDKAANLLGIDIYKIKSDEERRTIVKESIESTILEAREQHKKYFIVICNMMTTMFGSIDDIDIYVDCLSALKCEFKIHVDGAFGGFYYPFSNKSSRLTFENTHISSFTLDAHKMAQAPYGTGIFIVRKGLIHYVNTEQATYVEGEDLTLIGSRSGANAIAVWMILAKHGPFGWQEKIFILQKRTEWMCNQLNQLNVEFYRNNYSNIIAIKGSFVNGKTARLFGLVPDSHLAPKWYKIVIMEHVTIEKLSSLIERLKYTIKEKV
jgi:tyrosine decarboxylase / aspartate 1-decarboxylase